MNETMENKEVTQLTTDELIEEFAWTNKMSKFYYSRKEEIIKEIERRTLNGRN